MAHRPLAQAFYFDSLSYSPDGTIVFEYSTDAGHRFTHTLTHHFPVVDPATLAPALFALGMAEIPGYWKAILAPQIVVRAGALNTEQVAFWENLYIQGLGEFFYTNQIDYRGIVRVTSDPGAPSFTPSSVPLHGALVPFGGGKDSLVTGELLREKKKEFQWFELEPLPGNAALMAETGITSTVEIGRSITNFKPVIELVAQGAPNGHVPISSVYIFSAALAALAYGKRDIIPSLERSAEFGNVEYLGSPINHQYSKSFEFERAASNYLSAYVHSDMRLFSLLRPWYEIQIVERFTKFPQYFGAFISCNRGLKTGIWCGQCAKCAFMFEALSAFLPPERVVAIFKKNLFEDISLIPLYRDLIGTGAMKPFDCVGTFEENRLALYLASKQYTSLPPVLSSLPISEGAAFEHLLHETGPSNIPAEYA